MEPLELPPVLQKFIGLGDGWGEHPEDWVNYSALGVGTEHTPLLIDTLRRAKEFWVEADNEESDIPWVPLHAWRALAQMRVEEAIPAFIALLPLIDEDGNDVILEDIPEAFGVMGPAALPGLSEFLLERGNSLWARIDAADALTHIAQRFPEKRLDVIDMLACALHGYAEDTVTLNGFLVSFLGQLDAVEAAPLVEEAFQADRVDKSILGDWEDFQVEIGLLDHRLNPRKSFRLPDYSLGNEPLTPEERHNIPMYEAKQRKEKQKLKQARSMRKKIARGAGKRSKKKRNK